MEKSSRFSMPKRFSMGLVFAGAPSTRSPYLRFLHFRTEHSIRIHSSFGKGALFLSVSLHDSGIACEYDRMLANLIQINCIER